MAIKDAGINLLSDIAECEGRMSEIDAMRKAGASTAKEIAKELKLPVKP